MSDSPDAIRADIERTRQELGGDVDALVDKVTPAKIVGRQTDRMRTALRGVSERVMGAADDAGASMSGAASDAASDVGEAKDRLVAKAEGNPLAVGLIAFGVGLVVSSLIPASSKERQAAAALKDQAQPLVDEVKDAVAQTGQHLKEPVQDAADAVKESASESVDRVSDQARSAGESVKGQTQQARDGIADA